MNKDNALKAAGVAVVGAAGALASNHVIDPGLAAAIGAIVNFILGLLHSQPKAG